jgi:hypothetical protein
VVFVQHPHRVRSNRRSFVWRTFLALALALVPGAAGAQRYDEASRTVTVVPSGVDDTEALRTAFETCASVGAGCTVQLTEGTFFTRQHVIRDFHGTFAGAGMDATVIEPLVPLPVSQAEMVLAELPTDEAPWPILFLFFDADMTLRDLGFRVTQEEVTDTWRIFDMEIEVLATLVAISGDRTRTDVVRVHMESGEGTWFGVNVINGIYIQGIAPGPSGGFGDRPPLAGTVTIRDSRIVGPDGSVSIENLDRATVSIRGNHFDGVLSLYVQDVAHSLIEIVDNDVSTSDTAVYLSAGGFKTPVGPSTVIVAGNTLRVGEGAHGVLLIDGGDVPTLRVLVERNDVVLTDATAAVGGVGEGAVVRDNVVRGSAAAGLRIGPAPLPDTAAGDAPDAPVPATSWLLAGNDMSGLVAEFGAIWLTDVATGTVVVCAGETSVVDEGVGTVLACD